MHCVIVFEPALEGEELTLEAQIHQVFGPFADGDAADAWLQRFEAKLAVEAEHAIEPSHFTYLITRMEQLS